MLSRRNKFFIIAAAAALITLITISCGKKKVERPEEHPQKILRLSISSDPSTLDPAYVKDVTGGRLISILFNGLVRFNLDSVLVGDAADTWNVASDNRTYTFKLKNNIRFKNGELLTSGDVRYSYERVLKKSPRAWVLMDIEGARAFSTGRSEELSGISTPDSFTVVIRLEKPFAPFLGKLAMPNASIVNKKSIDKWGKDAGEHPGGTGPFYLSSWKHDEKLIFTKNPGYFDHPAKIDGISYRVIEEPLVRVTEFETGRLDIVEVPESSLNRLKNNKVYRDRVIRQSGLNIYFIGINCNRPPFDNAELRRAIAMSIDKQTLLAAVRRGNGKLAHGPIPPGLAGYDAGMKGIEYNPQEAINITSRYPGVKNTPVEFLQTNNKEILGITEAIAEMLKKTGFRVKMIQRERSSFKENLYAGKFHIFYYSWWADYPDAENFLFPLFHTKSFGPGGNSTFYSVKEVDSMIEKAQATVNLSERINLYRRIETRVVEDAPRVFLWHKLETYCVQPRVVDFKLPVIYNANKFTDIDLR